MIIELFGPPGVGKTTLACALANRLRTRGEVVELVLSSRRTEDPQRLDPDGRFVSRPQARPTGHLIRPVALVFGVGYHLLANKLVPMIVHLLATRPDADIAMNMMRLAPPRNLLWSIRLREYLIRLCNAWHNASHATHFVLFDQAYVQAICSLALLSRTTLSDNKIAELLDAVPKPDLLIRLDAPQDILEARLAERRRLQSRIEQLFELDASANQRLTEIADRLYGLVQKHAQSVTSVNSADEHCLARGMERISNEVLANLVTERAATSNATGVVEADRNRTTIH